MTSLISHDRRQQAPDPTSRHPRGLWTSESLVDSLRDGRRVWHEGELVDVTTHPNLRPPLDYLAELQDRQQRSPLADAVTQQRPDGLTASISYNLPHTREELEQKARASHAWMAATHGLMPRLPDFMANVVVGLWDYRGQLATVDPRFAENVERFYQECRDHDLVLTHAIGDPQMDRSVTVKENPDMALRVIDRSSDGIVVRGAKQLATLAPYSHEALVYLSPTYARRDLPEHVCWFSVPMASPGLTLMTRPSMAGRRPAGRELADRYDEQDTMLFFDDVFIPFHRVFLLDDASTALQGFWHLNKWSLYVGQVRFHHRLRFCLTVAHMAARAIGVGEFREVKADLGELAQYVELSRMALNSMLHEAETTSGGLYAPASTLAMDTFAAQISARVMEILVKVSGSGAVMSASPKDFEQEELAPLIHRYMHGSGVTAEEKAAIFQLVRGLVCTDFGARLHIYEKWNRGDPVRNLMSLADAVTDTPEAEAALLADFPTLKATGDER